MKGVSKHYFLRLDCNLNNYCIISDGIEGNASDYYTDVCGLAQIGETVYCAKTNTACKTFLYAYSPFNKKTIWITDLPLDYYRVGMAAYVQNSEQKQNSLSDLFFIEKKLVNGDDKSIILRLACDSMIKKAAQG